MSAFIACKQDGVIYLAAECFQSPTIIADSKISKSNYPVRVLDNDNGKIIITVDGAAREGQMILEAKGLIRKHEKVDASFMTEVLYKRVNDLLEHCSIMTKRKEDDFPVWSILIIANGEVYLLCENGFLKSTPLLSNFRTLELITAICVKKGDLKGERMLLKSFDMGLESGLAPFLPVVTINDKDFKFKCHKMRGL